MNRYNKYQNEIIDNIDLVLGLLITIRMVESDSLNVDKHWSNNYIERLSESSQKIIKGDDDCSECFGSGVTYPAFAESNIDGEKCQICNGIGLNSVDVVKKLFLDIQEIAKNKQNQSLIDKIEYILSSPAFS